jgi:ketosteroid isomerase-like protein
VSRRRDTARTMSQENVELTRQAFEHYLRTGELQWESVDPEVEVHDHDIPDAGTYRGHDGYRKWLEDWGEAWDSFSMEPERWIDAGDQVVLIFQMTARGKGSGVEVKRRDAIVWTVSDGKTVRIDYYNNEAQALEATGSSEERPEQDSNLRPTP